jgi:magnesium and cobalt exporter, CNNM family
MDDGFYVEIALVVVLIVLNGVFSAAEIAIISASRGRLQSLAEAGDRRAAAALSLKSDPDRFLATVQIGVTALGTLASAIGGVAAIERLEPVLARLQWPWAQAAAEPVAVGLVVLTIAYASLVVGELVPKALAVRHAEALTLSLAPKIDRLSRAARPAVSVLTASSGLVLRLLGRSARDVKPFHTLDDLRAFIREAEEQGVVRNDVVRGAVEFHERQIREVITPRPRVKALPSRATLAEALRLVRESGHSRLPVYHSSLDDATGFVYAREIYEAALADGPFDLAALARPLLMVSAKKAATDLLSEMRQGRVQMALVVDERGTVLGIATLEDLLEVIVGEIHDEGEQEEERVRRVGPDALEVDGTLAIHQINDEQRTRLPESARYTTVAGLVLDRLETLPHPGQQVDVPPYRMTVTAIDGARISKVRIEGHLKGADTTREPLAVRRE